MRASHPTALLRRLLQQAQTAGPRGVLVGVELPGELRPLELDGGHMDRVPPDQQLACAGRHAKAGRASLVTRRRSDLEHVSEDLAGAERPGPIVKAREPRLASEQRHLRFGHPQLLERREGVSSAGQDQPVRVILVRVGQGYKRDPTGVDPGLREGFGEPSHARQPGVRGPCVHQSEPSRGVDEKRVDRQAQLTVVKRDLLWKCVPER